MFAHSSNLSRFLMAWLMSYMWRIWLTCGLSWNQILGKDRTPIYTWGSERRESLPSNIQELTGKF